MNAIVALISAVSVLAVSALHLDFSGVVTPVCAPAGKFVKEVLAFSHCKHGGLVLLHVLLHDGVELFFHVRGGVVVEVENRRAVYTRRPPVTRMTTMGPFIYYTS